MALTVIFRTFHPKTAEYTSFSSAHRTFSRIETILAHKTSLNKFKKIKVIPDIFSNQRAMKVEVNHKKKSEKTTNTWRLCNMLLNNDWSGPTRKSKKKQKSTWKQMKMKTQWSKTFGVQQKWF